MNKNTIKRCGATLVATTVLCGSLPYQALAWEEETIKQWENVDILKGEQTGAFHADAAIIRAEFIALVNGMLGFTKESDSVRQYKDITSDAWYYHDVAKALEAGYLFGTSSQEMSPLAHITNEEMYAILARIAKTEEGSTMLSHVPDQTDIATWAKKRRTSHCKWICCSR